MSLVLLLLVSHYKNFSKGSGPCPVDKSSLLDNFGVVSIQCLTPCEGQCRYCGGDGNKYLGKEWTQMFFSFK